MNNKELEEILSNLQYLSANDTPNPNGGHPNWADIERVKELDLKRAKKAIQSLLKQAELRGASEKLKSICRKHWQLPIPEQAMLNEIKELEAELKEVQL